MARVMCDRIPDQVEIRLRGAGVSSIVRAATGAVKECRRNDDATGIVGYAAVFGRAYDVAGGPPVGFVEVVRPGAFAKTLREQDVRLLLNHDGLPLARTSSGTMRLSEDDHGLRVEVDELDTHNPRVAELLSGMRRGDVSEMSFAFRAIRDNWDADFTRRELVEVHLLEVSVVAFAANPSTTVQIVGDDGSQSADGSGSISAGGAAPMRRLRGARLEMMRFSHPTKGRAGKR